MIVFESNNLFYPQFTVPFVLFPSSQEHPGQSRPARAEWEATSTAMHANVVVEAKLVSSGPLRLATDRTNDPGGRFRAKVGVSGRDGRHVPTPTLSRTRRGSILLSFPPLPLLLQGRSSSSASPLLASIRTQAKPGPRTTGVAVVVDVYSYFSKSLLTSWQCRAKTTKTKPRLCWCQPVNSGQLGMEEDP